MSYACSVNVMKTSANYKSACILATRGTDTIGSQSTHMSIVEHAFHSKFARHEIMW